MAAFERVSSGIPEMDMGLDNIRLGDNVVWQVTSLEEFRFFVVPYVQRAVADKRNVIYVRFASHEPLLEEQKGVKRIDVELSHRFETFTVEIHNLIEREGMDAFYVFDCLSELQTAWATDLMMGNFFKVTCPFLFRLDTVAYFPLIRGKHSFKAIAQIRDTTQLFLDIYSDADHIYIRPLKVWNRYSETMFMPHICDRETKRIKPITDGVSISRFYNLMNMSQASEADQNMDSWDRFFAVTQQMHQQGMDVTEACSRMCNIMMTRDEKLRKLVKENFKPEDYFQIRSRMIGTGMIGGKACGMLLARKLIENKRPDLYARLEPHDSYYIGSDVFYAYIVHNDFWDIRIRQRTREEYFSIAGEFAECLRSGAFAENEREQFCRLLDYYGQNPIIVRSSSILEDGFGNAFAGKYESVFCANSGTMEERLQEFERAIKTVYASTMSESALDYRLRRGLASRDEQMSILVQRVSGSWYGTFFMPCAAGVGYSYSPYRFLEKIDPCAGMLRLVMGLGTGAVDRTQGSYPRLVSLDMPRATAATTIAEKHQFSQRKVDLINTVSGEVEHSSLAVIADKMPEYLKRILLEHDYEAESAFRERGQRREVYFISCEGLVRKQELMDMMRDCMAVIQDAYDYPVDIEYTINISKEGEYVVNLLQCRPLQIAKDRMQVAIPDKGDFFLDLRHASMGLSCEMKLDYIVFVNPGAYYRMEYNAKSKIAQAIGAVNRYFANQGRHILLLVPGRIGTSSPELGVPTTFADISEFSVICEVSDSEAGYMPELSYGSHIFQDLVEADILYGAIFENEKTRIYKPEKLEKLPNTLLKYYPAGKGLDQIMGVYEVGGTDCRLYHDMKAERLCCVFPECPEFNIDKPKTGIKS
ncbi:MAG: PEP/pyruvate-binding domain-containing protein [Clostridiaceae bacterium]|nr:PEP/pyruvate-binding domain-containing protein [Clostridiaceae bacterium]